MLLSGVVLKLSKLLIWLRRARLRSLIFRIVAGTGGLLHSVSNESRHSLLTELIRFNADSAIPLSGNSASARS